MPLPPPPSFKGASGSFVSRILEHRCARASLCGWLERSCASLSSSACRDGCWFLQRGRGGNSYSVEISTCFMSVLPGRAGGQPANSMPLLLGQWGSTHLPELAPPLCCCVRPLLCLSQCGPSLEPVSRISMPTIPPAPSILPINRPSLLIMNRQEQQAKWIVGFLRARLLMPGCILNC